MAISIVATVGSATANSFITEAEFIAYLATRLNVHTGATVSGSTCSETEKAAMIEATRDLNPVAWVAERTDGTQSLSWPRSGAPNPDSPDLDDTGDSGLPEFDDDVIPTRVKNATCELALQYMKAGTTDLAAPSATSGVIRKKVGPLETEYTDPAQRATGLARFPRVYALIAPLTNTSAGGLTLERS